MERNVVKIIVPELSDEERARREKVFQDACVDFMKKVWKQRAEREEMEKQQFAEK